MNNKEIEKFLIKIELNSDSYITGEFLYKTNQQIHLLNSMYTNGDKVVLPSVALNISDIKSVSKLNQTETLMYMNIVSSKNMLYFTEPCSKCDREDKEDEYSGIKTIDEGFESVCEQSSEESEMDLCPDKEFEVQLDPSTSEEDDSSSSVSEEDIKEAFARKLALRNSAVTFKEEPKTNNTQKEEKEVPVEKPQVIFSSSLKDIIDLQNLHLYKNITDKKWQKASSEFDQNKKVNRRREFSNQHRKESTEKEPIKKRAFSRAEQSKSNLPKGTIVYGWKQKKYKDGFEILKGISSDFNNKINVPEGWSALPPTTLDELGRSLYHDGLKKEKTERNK